MYLEKQPLNALPTRRRNLPGPLAHVATLFWLASYNVSNAGRYICICYRQLGRVVNVGEGVIFMPTF